MSDDRLDELTIYTQKAEGESLKLQPKAEYSVNYKERPNLRVAAYIRVSTDSDDQQTSFDTQMKHYQSFISAQSNWTLADIYADDGISGTSIKNRKGFNQMVADAKAGKFDMIITKSVSRYARNLVDGITTARDLLQNKPPVGIMFEEEGLNTFRPDTEFFLSVMLLMAQGESEKKSTSIKKAFQWRCDEKDFLTPVESLIGYTKDENKKLIIEPEGAKTVRAIYAMHLFGLSSTHIAYLLTSSGKLTGKKRSIWSSSSVNSILRNERFCGDIIAQKTVTTNVLEHKTEKNTGQAVLHYFDKHHEGIVSREEYVRSLLLLRSNCASAYYNPDYEVEAVRDGVLAGFIPLNFAFGGYDAEHYLGAEIRCGVKLPDYTVDIMRIPDSRIVRTQEIEHKLAAQVTISTRAVTFNADCVSRFHEAEYVEVLLHPSERLLAVRLSTKENRNAVPWSTKSISAASFCPILYTLMGWNECWKYKFIADCFVRGKEKLLMFNLSEPEFQFVETVSENEEIKARIRRLLLPGNMRDGLGEDYVSRIISNRRAYAFSLKKWQVDAPALPIESFNGNPVKRTEEELEKYLDEQGVKYERK